jgi:nitronate monooxygenase
VVLDDLAVPVVLAPLAGGPSTVELAVAVADAGGLGFLAAGYLSASDLDERLARFTRLSSGPPAVNLFVPGPGPTAPDHYAAYLTALTGWASERGLSVGEPRYSDDDWDAKLEVLAGRPPAVASFTFGCPSAGVVADLQAQGTEVWVTVTSPEEAAQAAAVGVDVLVAQGAEAGGHRGSFADGPRIPLYGVLALVGLVRAAVPLPVVASGGIATGAAIAAALAAGAQAAQLGTAFLLAPEAGTSTPHRRALALPNTTVLTRAFTGRLARGLRNGFTDTHSATAPVAYPELHYVTAPMRRRAREEGDSDLVNLWAGEAYALARELPAGELVGVLGRETRDALAAAQARMGSA